MSQTSLRIGFVLDDSLDRPDGVQQYVLTLGRWLTKQGHDVFYLVGQTSRSDIPGIHSMSKVLRVKINGNIVGTPLPANKNSVKKLLATLNLDVIHVQILYSPVLAGKVIECASVKTAVVGTIHIFPSTKFSHLMYKFESIMNKKTLSHFDEIVAVSKVAAEASHLNKLRKISIVPNPVDISRFRPGQDPKKTGRKIVFLGRLVPRKGCQLLLQAISELNANNELPDGTLVEVAGSGPLESKLKSYVQANGLQQIVSFKGFIQEESKPAFLQAADIAVFPSSGGESFGIVLIEAMAARAIALGGNNPGYACVLNAESNELFDTRSPHDLALKLKELISNVSYANTVRARQAEHVKQFDMNVVGTQIVTTYNKALRSRSKMG